MHVKGDVAGDYGILTLFDKISQKKIHDKNDNDHLDMWFNLSVTWHMAYYFNWLVWYVTIGSRNGLTHSDCKSFLESMLDKTIMHIDVTRGLWVNGPNV